MSSTVSSVVLDGVQRCDFATGGWGGGCDPETGGDALVGQTTSR
ncbi:hypothetical protein [Nesterenkonia sp. LB17]|nr:hypothetical protein [Nesterenkonia sp. LB17]